ncbi:unnamed protein product [Dracunculus medinensis]|uniref:Zf-C3HC4 domain-containing protein n=1 Tax=Dracunculus medinensis TaxID=318479 RepID=A0A0N4UNA0_DRAME|nr:unnamed protein product [Dracunculus medinensis]
MRYLLNVRNETPGDCPICYNSINISWVVLPCAHCICPQCFHRLANWLTFFSIFLLTEVASHFIL